MPRRHDLRELADRARDEMLASNAEQALQAGVELMLVSHPTAEVVRCLRLWADYLEERI